MPYLPLIYFMLLAFMYLKHQRIKSNKKQKNNKIKHHIITVTNKGIKITITNANTVMITILKIV